MGRRHKGISLILIVVGAVAVIIWWQSTNGGDSITPPTNPTIITPTATVTLTPKQQLSEFVIQVRLVQSVSRYRLNSSQVGVLVIFYGTDEWLDLKPDDLGQVKYAQAGIVGESGLVTVYPVGDTSRLLPTILPFRLEAGKVILLQSDGQTPWGDNVIPVSSISSPGADLPIVTGGCVVVDCPIMIVRASGLAWPSINISCQQSDDFSPGPVKDLRQAYRSPNEYSIEQKAVDAQVLSHTAGWLCQYQEWSFFVRSSDGSMFWRTSGTIASTE